MAKKKKTEPSEEGLVEVAPGVEISEAWVDPDEDDDDDDAPAPRPAAGTKEYATAFARVVHWGPGHYVFRGDASDYPVPTCSDCGARLDDPAFLVLDVIAGAEGFHLHCPSCVAEGSHSGRYAGGKRSA